MKRLAVAFQTKRDQSLHQAEPPPTPAADVPKKRVGFFSRSSSNRGPSELNVPANTYSSSSSDGSVVQTPEPDEEEAPPPSTQRWASWIRSKPAKAKTQHVADVWVPPSPESRTKRIPADPPATTLDSEDDSDHYDDEQPTPPVAPPTLPRSRTSSHSPARSSRVLQPATQLRAHMNVRAISLSSLIPPLSPPPLLHLPSSPLFPRSSNPARSLKRLQTTHTVLHKTVLLRRLENQTLTRSENESIAAFGHRPKYVVPKTRRHGGIEEEAMSDVKKVRFYSRGLQVWLDRPCFEERCVQWMWDAEGKEVVVRGIVGSDRAVASLEFSEGLETLAGYGLEPYPSIPTPAPSKTAPLPPPLRITSSSPYNEAYSAGSSTPNASTGPTTPTTALPLSATPRKILRFLPDPDPEDEEDNVPLGFHVNTKRERERLAEERVRQAQERVIDEERMKKVYAAEVAAARARREGARAGSMHEAELEKAKDNRRGSYTRTAYDPAQANSRRMASEPDPRSRPQTLSRPPSIADTHSQVKSRPSSIRSERMPSYSAQTLPPSPPLPRSQTQPMQVDKELEDAKRRRRQSNLSEGAGSVRARTPSAPTASLRSSVYPRTMPRSYSSGPGMSGMPMPVPPLPTTVPVMPMFVMPGAPQFFVPQMQPQMQMQMQSQMQLQAQMQMQMQMQMQQPPHSPLLPPIRPGLPVSRSTEGLLPPRSRHSGRNEPSSSSNPRPTSMPRSVSNGDDVRRASRMAVPVPPVSFMQSPPPRHTSGSSSRGHRQTPSSR